MTANTITTQQRLAMASDFVQIQAPSEYANSELNGSRGIVLTNYGRNDIVLVLLTSGPAMGKQWQFNPGHLRLLSESEGRTDE